LGIDLTDDIKGWHMLLLIAKIKKKDPLILRSRSLFRKKTN
jgi:hypothetical protein